MAAVWVIGELADGSATRLTRELASLALGLAGESDGSASVLLVGADEDAATELAASGVEVVAAQLPAPGAPAAANVATLAAALIAERAPDIVLIGATPDGHDVAGMLVGLTGLPILVAATELRQEAGEPLVEMAAFGGRALTTSAFRDGRGIILIRPGATGPAPRAAMGEGRGAVERVELAVPLAVPPVAIVERVQEAVAGPTIDDARIIVGAGRGIGGPAGLELVEELARTLQGAVGATRAVVDAGWADFGQQIGQTGKTVKPELYIACGISGAIQHKVGVQSAGAIVAINKDADAPIAGFADLLVIGDLFEIVPRLNDALREARRED